MRLAAPVSAPVGATFTLSVHADPAPSVPIGGFATEVLFSSGLDWVQRPSCNGPDGEVPVTVDGTPLGICVAESGPEGQARHVVVSIVEPPPIADLDTPLDVLLELDVKCTSAGSHSVVLTSLSDDYPFGAFYALVNTHTVVPKTQPFDVDGDTAVEQVADVIEIDCSTGDPSSTVAGAISAPDTGKGASSGDTSIVITVLVALALIAGLAPLAHFARRR
jgi:hypothetical protein